MSALMHTLTLAVPSKGRLQEQVARYLADAGLALKQVAGARDYRASLDGLDVLRSADIAAVDGEQVFAGLDVDAGLGERGAQIRDSSFRRCRRG